MSLLRDMASGNPTERTARPPYRGNPHDREGGQSAMSHYHSGVPYLDGLALTVSGYFRRRPDRTAEAGLRAAFAELDRELSVILADRCRTASAGRDQAPLAGGDAAGRRSCR